MRGVVRWRYRLSVSVIALNSDQQTIGFENAKTFPFGFAGFGLWLQLVRWVKISVQAVPHPLQLLLN